MNKGTVLIGAGGHARVVLECLGDKASGFVDEQVNEFSGLGKLGEVKTGSSAIVSFGGVTPEELQRRNQVFNDYKNKGTKFVRAIHPSAIISALSSIGEGSMIGPGVIVNPGVKIGSNTIINSGAIIEHDAQIGEGSHIAPGAIILGEVIIGKAVMIGAGAVVLPKSKVPDNSLVKSLTRYPG